MSENVADSAKYMLKWELMREITDAVTDEPAVRYRPDRTGMPKADVVAVADALDVAADEDLGKYTLSELYGLIAKEIGMEPPQPAGNDWGLHRAHLKAIYRRTVQ